MTKEYKQSFLERLHTYYVYFNQDFTAINYHKKYKKLISGNYTTKYFSDFKSNNDSLAWIIYWNKRFIKEIKK